MRRIESIISRLKNEYPHSTCELPFRNAWELLALTMLSAQTTDRSVIRVAPGLFRKYPSVEDFARAKPGGIEKEIKTIGLAKSKSRNLVRTARKILSDFDGSPPGSLKELTTLPGVGRKTANVVLGNYFGVPAIAVDTHVKRISARLGFTKHREPEKIEADLENIVPRKDWALITHLLIRLGREFCTSRRPDCSNCPVSRYCPKILSL